MEFLFFYVLLCCVVAAAASSRNRSGTLWFMWSVLLSPLIAGLFVLVIGHGGKTCLACRKSVHHEATVCPYCRTNV